MRRFWFAIVILFLFPTVLFAQSSPFPADPNLDKPVTLAVKGGELSDITASLAKQTGAKLRINKDLPRMKATIFVDNKPLRDVMTGLETLFQFQWSVVKDNSVDYYELQESSKAREERLTDWDKAYADAWNNQDSRFRLVADYAAKSPSELLAIKKKLDEKAEQASQPGSEITLTPEEINAQSIISIGAEPDQVFIPDGDFLLFYRQFSPEVLNALKSGNTVCFDSASVEPQWRIPEDITMRLKKSYGGQDDSRYGLKFFVKRTNSKLTMHVNMQESNSSMKTVIGDGISTTGQTVSDYLPHTEFPEMLTKAFGIKKEELLQETGINPASVDNILYANKSDLLALIHKKFGIQIIADHYLFWSSADIPNEYTATDWINNNSFPQRYCGWDGKFFYVRAAASLGLDAAEIPDNLLRKWQNTYASQGYLGLQDLAEIAASLWDDQIDSILRNAVFLKLAKSSNDLGNIGIWSNYNTGDPKISALRLYHKLDAKQKQQAFSTGISAKEFNADQRSTLAEYLTVIDLPISATNEINYPIGIYKNGIRVDKQVSASLFDLITISLKAPIPYEFTDPDGTRIGIQGKSVDEAWKNVQNECASMGISKSSIAKGRLYPNTGVEVILKFSGGDTHETQINVLGKSILPPTAK